MSNQIVDRIKNYFENDKLNTKTIFNMLSFFIFQLESKETDLYILAKLLPDEYLIPLLSYFDGAQLRMPTYNNFKELKILALIFYMKEIQGKNWNDIKKVLNFPENFNALNSISLGKKTTFIKENLVKSLSVTIQNISEEDFEKHLKGALNERQ